MKKLTAILLALLLTVSMTACKDNGDVRGEITPGSNQSSSIDSSVSTVEKEFDTGKVSSNKYVNTFAGLSCELNSDWTFLTDAQIEENNKTALGLIDESYAEAIENANTFTDMMATHANQTDTVNITFEKLTGVNLAINEEQYANLSKDSLKSAFESMSMTNVVVTTGKAEFAGATHTYIELSAQYSGIPVYEKIAVVKCQNYVVLVCACTWQTNTCSDILDTFKAA